MLKKAAQDGKVALNKDQSGGKKQGAPAAGCAAPGALFSNVHTDVCTQQRHIVCRGLFIHTAFALLVLVRSWVATCLERRGNKELSFPPCQNACRMACLLYIIQSFAAIMHV